MSKIKCYLKKIISILKFRHDEIISICSVVTIFIGIFGFCFTIYSLKMTNRAIKSSNAYSIQRDARDLNEKIYERGYIISFLKNGSEKIGDNVKKDLWVYFNFYLSVFRQGENGGVDDEFKNSFKEDFCNFLEFKKINDAWAAMVDEGLLSVSNVTMRREWCQ